MPNSDAVKTTDRHFPPPSSHVLAPPLPTDDAAPAQHQKWASLIKSHHYSLQQAMQSQAVAVADEDTASSTTGATAASSHHAVTSNTSYTMDLMQWQHALQGAEAEGRLAAYAEAMHHLATRYWDSGTSAAPLNETSSPESREPVERAVLKQPRLETTYQDVGSTVKVEVAAVSEFPPAGAEDSAIYAPPLTQRRYNDRLQYCLDSVVSYFYGTNVHVTVDDRDSMNGLTEEKNKETPPQLHRQTVSLPPPPLQASQTAFFFGSGVYEQLPVVVARAVKPLRRLFFEHHSRMATAAEVSELASLLAMPTVTASSSSPAVPTSPSTAALGTLSAAVVAVSLIPAAQRIIVEDAWRRGAHSVWPSVLRLAEQAPTAPSTSSAVDESLLPHSLADAESAAAQKVSKDVVFHIMDVGSCYGPFNRDCQSLTSTHATFAAHMEVTAMDLEPYDARGLFRDGEATIETGGPVWKGDWLQLCFFTPDAPIERAGDTMSLVEDGRLLVHSEPTLSGGAGLRRWVVRGVALESYDAVFFCLLLSYMPNPRLRFLACLHAYLALKEGGLLVVVSTRTQGPRQGDWIVKWTASLKTIGFTRVQQQVREKIVGMTFAKESPSLELAEQLRSGEEGRAAWLAEMMATSAASTGLYVTADSVTPAITASRRGKSMRRGV